MCNVRAVLRQQMIDAGRRMMNRSKSDEGSRNGFWWNKESDRPTRVGDNIGSRRGHPCIHDNGKRPACRSGCDICLGHKMFGKDILKTNFRDISALYA